MGLDMYLSVRRNGYLKNGNKKIDLDNLKDDFKNYESNEFGISNSISIIENVAYWRKANAIHGWFVKNCQDGRDECQESYVEQEKLKELYGICKGILAKVDGLEMKAEGAGKDDKEVKKVIHFDKNKLRKMFDSQLWCRTFNDDVKESIKKYCSKVLPPTAGFFFGTYEVDGGYIYDIVKTVLMLDDFYNKAEKWDKEKVFYDIYYNASW